MANGDRVTLPQDELPIVESVLPEGARVERETARAERGVGGGVADKWRGAGDYYYELTDEGIKVTGGDRARSLTGGKSTLLRWDDTNAKTMEMVQAILASRTGREAELGATYKAPETWDDKRSRAAERAYNGDVSSQFGEWMGPEGAVAGYAAQGPDKPMAPFSAEPSPREGQTFAGLPPLPDFIHMYRKDAQDRGLPVPTQDEAREAYRQVLAGIRKEERGEPDILSTEEVMGLEMPPWMGPADADAIAVPQGDKWQWGAGKRPFEGTDHTFEDTPSIEEYIHERRLGSLKGNEIPEPEEKIRKDYDSMILRRKIFERDMGR